MFTLTIKTDNAAFGDNDFDRSEEVAKCLEKVAERLRTLACRGARVVRDSNGNVVGEFALTSEKK